MIPSKETPQKGRLFYGWYVMASSSIILFFNAGARYSFSVMFKSILAEFGWSRASLSMAFFLNMTVFSFSIIVAGKLYDRHGPKWVIVISTVFLLAGYTLMSTTSALWQFYIYYGVIAAMGLGGTSVPLISTLMSKWFEKRRGLAVSLSIAGNCLGQFALVPVFTLFSLRFGWRISFCLIGLIMFVVNTVLALGVIRGDPQHLGYTPFGHPGGETTEGEAIHVSSNRDLQDIGLRGAMRTSSLWLFFTFMFICGAGDFLVSMHLISIVTDYGISPITAGNMLAWYGLMGLVGILIAGVASDRIGNKIPIAITFLLRVLSFLLILKYQTLISFYVFSLIFGFTYLVTGPLTPILVGRLYGFSHVGSIAGFLNTVHYLGGGFWAYMGGWIFDQTGSYRLAFALSAVMALIAAVCTMLITEKRYVPKGQAH